MEGQADTVAKTLEESAAGAAAWFLFLSLLSHTSLATTIIKLSIPGRGYSTSRLIIYSLVSCGGELKNVFATVSACLSIGINRSFI